MCDSSINQAPAPPTKQEPAAALPAPPAPGAAEWHALCHAVAGALPAQYQPASPLDELRNTVAAALPARLALLGWGWQGDPPGEPHA